MMDGSNTVPPEKAEAFVRDRLSEKRLAHTLRVAETAESLARTHGLDVERTRLAALLHDAAREVSQEELLHLAKEWNIPFGEPELESPKLLHGPVAAEQARRELGVEDEDVLEAIRAHTVGEAGMGPVALAVYVADKIEPARDYPSVGRIRALAGRDLRAAAIESIRRARDYNERRGRGTHPSTLKMLAWLEQSL